MNHELPATPAALQAHIAELEQQYFGESLSDYLK